ncbi:MAG TPA: sulfatase-like hydrolase/transferase, partial [Longimicrobiales bacterium]
MVTAVARTPLALVTEEPAAQSGVQAAPARDALAAAAWFALLGAAGELSLLALRRLVLHEPIRMGPQVVWMTPAADLALFLLLALPLLALARRWPRAGSPRVVATIFAFLASMGVLLVMNWSYRFGFVILAAGMAAELGRRVADAPDAFRRLVERTLPAMLLAVLLVGTGYNAWRIVHERRMLASLPAARAGSPNILLLIWDTVRASELSAFGYPRPTSPVLERLARQGVAFDQAIATAPWTLPSHAGMFTGRYPHETSARWQHPLGTRWPTIAQVLSSRGYSTAGFVANTIYASYENGLQRGFTHYEDYGVT